MESIIFVLVVTGISFIAGKSMSKENNNSIGNSSKPNHQRVIRKTN